METKLFARITAGAFVAVALTMTVLTLREEREAPLPEMVTVWEPDGDPLPARLKTCAGMGEVALSSADCRAAWAEKRRRFLGIENGEPSPATQAEPPHRYQSPAQDQ